MSTKAKSTTPKAPKAPTKIKATPKAPKKTAESAPNTTTPTEDTTPTPPTPETAPIAPAPAPTPETPVSIELVQETPKSKRYVSKTDPDSKYHLRNRSTAMKPCHLVRLVVAENPEMSRKEVIEQCLLMGIDKNTAATQYSLAKAGKVKMPTVHLLAADGEDGEDGDEGEFVYTDDDEGEE